MSLINTMLRDLDARRGPGGDAQLAALQGIGLVYPRQLGWQRSVTFSAWALAAALLLVGGLLLSDSGLPNVDSADSNGAADQAEWTPLTLPQPNPLARSIRRQTLTSVGGKTAPKRTRQTEGSPPRRAPATRQQAEPESSPAAAPVSEQRPRAVQPAATPAALETTLSELPGSVRSSSTQQQAEQQFALAQRALAEQDWDNAERLLNRTLDLLAGHLEARGQLASLLMARQADDAAEKLLIEGLTIDPRAGVLAKPYAQLLAARDALPAALEVLATAHSDAETEALSAAILHRMNNHAEAARAYEAALQRQPQMAVWWTGLAIAREHNQEPRKALLAYQRAARLQLSAPVRQYVEQRMQALQIREEQ